MGKRVKRKLLVSGAAGFLAPYIAQKFRAERFQLIGVYRNTVPDQSLFDRLVPYKQSSLGTLFQKEQPDVFVHAAGSSNPRASFSSPFSDYEANTVLTYSFLEQIRRHSPHTKIVLLTSAAIYGNPHKLPISELAPPQPISPYGYHRLYSEMLGSQFANLFKLRVSTARLFSTYGPGLTRQVVWDITRQALQSETIHLRGSGNESRDFVFCTDVARAIYAISEKSDFTGEIFNVCSGREVSIAQLSGLVVSLTNPDAEIFFDGVSPMGMPVRWHGDGTKLAKLGFRSQTELKSGLEKTIEWIQSTLQQNSQVA